MKDIDYRMFIIYNKAKRAVMSCKTHEQYQVADKFIELSKKRFIKMFTKEYDCNNIKSIERLFEGLENFKTLIKN